MSRLRRRFVFGSPAASSTSPNAIGYQMCRSELNSAAPGTMVIDRDSDLWVKVDHALWELTGIVLHDEDKDRLSGNASAAEIKTSFAMLGSASSEQIRAFIATDPAVLTRSQDQQFKDAAPMSYGPVRYLGDATKPFLGRR